MERKTYFQRPVLIVLIVLFLAIGAVGRMSERHQFVGFCHVIGRADRAVVTGYGTTAAYTITKDELRRLVDAISKSTRPYKGAGSGHEFFVTVTFFENSKEIGRIAIADSYFHINKGYPIYYDRSGYVGGVELAVLEPDFLPLN